MKRNRISLTVDSEEVVLASDNDPGKTVRSKNLKCNVKNIFILMM